jgi:putative endonuclease
MWSWLPSWFRRWQGPLTLGERGEQAAERLLKRLGYKIVGRRVRFDRGELDLVAVDGRTVVFVEVKTRTSDDKGSPAEAVDHEKQRAMTRAAQLYLKRHGLLDCAARFDVVTVTWANPQGEPVVEHFPHAFESAW